MIIDDIKRAMRYSAGDLRKFGITMGVCFTVIGIILLIGRGHQNRIIFIFGVSLAFFASGMIYPKALALFYKLWMALAAVMGWVMTRIILTILFYLVVTPIGLFMKLSGKDLLKMRFDRNPKSYWIDRSSAEHASSSYEKQF